MKRVAIVIFFIVSYIKANNLNYSSIGMGGVDMAIGKNSQSILLNPANIPIKNELIVEFQNSILLNERTANFIKNLSSNSSQKISNLMKKNIGKNLIINGDNFTSIYKTQNSYSFLFGYYNSINGKFITHTGFGSMGAMESLVDRYSTLLTSFSLNQNVIKYGFNLRAITKHQTIHNYTIDEIIENDNILNYFENRYTKSKKALAFDIGGVYNIKNSKLALSILDIGDTSFKELGAIKSTTNFGFSTKYQDMLFGIDYIDMFNGSFNNSFRYGMSKSFDNLTINSGLLHKNLTIGLDYKYSIFNISISRYKKKSYQFSISLAW